MVRYRDEPLTKEKVKGVRRARRTKAEMEEWTEAIKEVIQEIHPQTNRAVFYAAEAANICRKTDEDCGLVEETLRKLRLTGQIPFEWIIDSTRQTHWPVCYESVKEALLILADNYQRDVWEDSEVHVDIWTEEDAVSAVLRPVTDFLCVPLRVFRGYSSITYLHTTGVTFESIGKPIFVYYFGDLDPSGQDIYRECREAVRRYAPTAEIHFELVAVTPEQVEKLELQTKPPKKSDTRTANYTEIGCVELQALNREQLQAIARECIMRHLDEETVTLYERLTELGKAEILELAETATD